MRFTPSEECQVLKAKMFSYINAGSPKACTLYVYDDESGKPGTQKFKTTYMPTHDTWDEIPITSTLIYDTDFWIIIKIPVQVLGSDIWAFSDDGVNYANKNTTKKDASGSWEVPGPYLYGDLCIRAIVSYTGVEEEELCPYEKVVLNQNHPNPVLNKTTISYTLPEETNVELKVYDITGKLVRTLVNGVQEAGQKRIVWDRQNMQREIVHSGVYFYKLSTNTDNSFTKVMVVF